VTGGADEDAVLAPTSLDDIRFVTRFSPWDREFASHPGAASSEVWAKLVGLPVEHYDGVVSAIGHAAERTAHELGADDSMRVGLDSLPFAAGETVVAVGDSITAERASWFEILQHASPGGWRAVNAAISGDTTVHTRARLQWDVLPHEPDWALVLIGSNDARFHDGTVLVRREESERNLDQLVQDLTGAGARVVLMTPPTVLDARQAERPFGIDMVWRTDELAARAEIARRVAERHEVVLVDVFDAFAGADERDFLFDGLHPSIRGQTRIVRELVRTLAPI
jgi:lysophospholipase L1-like esterase